SSSRDVLMLTSRGPFRVGLVALPILLLLALAGWTSWTSAAEPLIVEQQSRAFKILVDGTERGTLTMSLAPRNDGTATVRRRADPWQRIGAEQLIVATQPVTATHYRIRGDVDVDLWYDDEGRLVRQTSLESGHRTLLELTKIRR